MQLSKPKPTRPPRKPTVRPTPPPEVSRGRIQEPGVNFELLCDMLRECNAVYVRDLPHDPLRDFLVLIQSVAETCGKRLNQLENQRNAQLCANPDCNKILPHGRFAGEIIIRDHLTNELIPLRACSEPCYRVIGQIANERRMQNVGHIRGSVAL